MDQTIESLQIYFSEILQNLNCNEDTRAYIVSVFSKNKSADHDLSKQSITLLYAAARERQDFWSFQKIGDWIFICESLFPEHLNNASVDYYHSLAQSSYYSCFKLINKKWRLYENLADDFFSLTQSSRKLIRNI